jgi:hypothetical protein
MEIAEPCQARRCWKWYLGTLRLREAYDVHERVYSYHRILILEAITVRNSSP